MQCSLNYSDTRFLFTENYIYSISWSIPSFAKLLTDWNTGHSLKRVIMYSSTKAITSFKQTNISLFLESEETFGYIQTGNTSTDYGHVT